MSLRDMIVDIGFNADSSPVSDLNKAMREFTGNTNSAGAEVKKTASIVDIASRGMLKETQAFNKEVTRQSDLIRQLSRTSGMSATQLANDWSSMSMEMRKSMIQNHNDMQKYRQDLLVSENDMRNLGNQMGNYTGSTSDFMKEINKMGKAHKKATDQMINSNLSMRQGFIQTIATMSAMSGQSEKISANYDRMGNALLRVNNPLLAITNGLERMARQGNAATLALKMLGPNASMKALLDMTRMINQGIMRQQAVLMVAGAAWIGFTALLAHAGVGPDPGEIRKQQQQVTQVYRDAWNQRVSEISNFVGIFEKASIPKVKGSDLTKALQSQLNAMKIWRNGLQSLTKKGVDEGLIQELQKMGPAAAGQIQALNSMSTPQLNKYVSLWRQKMGLARQQATDELSKLRQDTAKKIQELQNSLTPLGVAWEKFKSTWASALKPFVDLWGQLAAGFVNVGTSVGNFFNKLNAINPWITKLAGMFLYLFTALLVILSPLAVGIGLFGGVQAAIAGVWAIIGPFVVGFASIAGTAALVAAAVVGVGAALYLLWTRSETFRNGVISGWNAIKSAALAVWGFIKPYIMQAIYAVVSFVMIKLAELKAFWNQHGAQIIGLVTSYFSSIWANIQMVLGLIKGIFQMVFPIIVGIVQVAWGYLKLIINNGLALIMGIIKVGLAIIRGDWSGAWTAIKQTAFTIMNNITKFFKDIDLFSIGKNIIQGLIDGISTMSKAVTDRIGAVADSLVKKFKDILGIKSPSRVFMGMGSHIIDGLVNGLTGGNLKELGMRVFKDFGGGVMNTWESIKGFLSGGGGSGSPGNVTGWLKQAMAITGVPPSWLEALQTIAMKESGGNPGSVNRWDSNAKKGTPSMGLMQTIQPTFSANKLPGHDSILNPVDNAIAAIRYIQKRYGNVFNVPGIKSMAAGGKYKGYATGTNGPLKTSQWAWVGERGPELMRLNRGTEVFSHNDSLGIASGTYNPTSGTTSSSSGSSRTINLDYSPTVNVYGSGGADGKNVKQQVQEALDEHYQKLLSLFGTEVEI